MVVGSSCRLGEAAVQPSSYRSFLFVGLHSDLCICFVQAFPTLVTPVHCLEVLRAWIKNLTADDRETL